MQSYQPLLKVSNISNYILIKKLLELGSWSLMSILRVWALVSFVGLRSLNIISKSIFVKEKLIKLLMWLAYKRK